MVGKGAAMVESILGAECAPLPTLQPSVPWCLASLLLDHDQILPFIHARDLARAYYGGAIKLVENSGSLNGEPDIEAVALIDRAFDRFAFEAGVAPFPQGVLERRAGWLETRHRN